VLSNFLSADTKIERSDKAISTILALSKRSKTTAYGKSRTATDSTAVVPFLGTSRQVRRWILIKKYYSVYKRDGASARGEQSLRAVVAVSNQIQCKCPFNKLDEKSNAFDICYDLNANERVDVQLLCGPTTSVECNSFLSKVQKHNLSTCNRHLHT